MKITVEIEIAREVEDVEDVKLLLYRLAGVNSRLSVQAGEWGLITAPCSTNPVGNWKVTA